MISRPFARHARLAVLWILVTGFVSPAGGCGPGEGGDSATATRELPDPPDRTNARVKAVKK